MANLSLFSEWKSNLFFIPQLYWIVLIVLWRVCWGGWVKQWKPPIHEMWDGVCSEMESRILIGFSQRKDKNWMLPVLHRTIAHASVCVSVFSKHLDVHIIDNGSRTFIVCSVCVWPKWIMVCLGQPVQSCHYYYYWNEFIVYRFIVDGKKSPGAPHPIAKLQDEKEEMAKRQQSPYRSAIISWSWHWLYGS